MGINRNEFHSRVRLLALGTFVVSLPFSMIVNNISIMVLVLNWLLEGRIGFKVVRALKDPLFLLFVSLYLFSIVALSYTSDLRQGIFHLEKTLAFLVFPLVLVGSDSISKSEIRLLFKGFVGACFLGCLICFGYAIQRNYQEGHTISYVYNAIVHDIHLPGRYEYFNYWYFTYTWFADGIGMHQTYLAMYTIFASCLAVWLWWGRDEKGISWWLILLLVFNFLVVVLLSSRTQLFVMTILGTTFSIYYSYLRGMVFRALLFISLLFGIGFSIIFWNPISRERFFQSMRLSAHYSENKFGEGGLSLRMYEWKYSLEAIKQFPLLGTGPGDSEAELQRVYEMHDFDIGIANKLNAHSQYLQTTLDLGLLGLLCFLTCLAVPAYRSLRHGELLYAVFIFIFALSCLTESMLEINKGIVFYSFFNSLFAFHFDQAAQS